MQSKVWEIDYLSEDFIGGYKEKNKNPKLTQPTSLWERMGLSKKPKKNSKKNTKQVPIG